MLFFPGAIGVYAFIGIFILVLLMIMFFAHKLD
jgi:hypothetical protein